MSEQAKIILAGLFETCFETNMVEIEVEESEVEIDDRDFIVKEVEAYLTMRILKLRGEN